MIMETKTSGMHRENNAFQNVFGAESASSKPWPRYVLHIISGPYAVMLKRFNTPALLSA